MTKRTSSPRWPCPSLPEASAENKPPSWRQAAAHAVGAGLALAALCSWGTDTGSACKPIQEQPNAAPSLDSSSPATQNPSVALQRCPRPKSMRKVSLPVDSQPRSPSPWVPLPARTRQGWVSHSWVIHSPPGRGAFLDTHSWAQGRGASPLIRAESLCPE